MMEGGAIFLRLFYLLLFIAPSQYHVGVQRKVLRGAIEIVLPHDTEFELTHVSLSLKFLSGSIVN